MERTIEGVAPTSFDVVVPHGCPMCEGPVALRLSAAGARTVCPACRYITEPEVKPLPQGRFELGFPPGAVA